MFVDHATDYTHVHFQRTDNAEETVEGKEAFERKAAEHGIKVKHYHADNGVFATKLWRSHCLVTIVLTRDLSLDQQHLLVRKL